MATPMSPPRIQRLAMPPPLPHGAPDLDPVYHNLSRHSAFLAQMNAEVLHYGAPQSARLPPLPPGPPPRTPVQQLVFSPKAVVTQTPQRQRPDSLCVSPVSPMEPLYLYVSGDSTPQ